MVAYSGFVGGTYRGTSRHVGVETCMNMYPELGPPQGAKPRPMVLYGTPGLSLFSTNSGSNPIRVLFHSEGRVFFVAGTDFNEVTAAGTITTHYSALIASTNPGMMVTNGTAGNQILLIYGGLGYIFNTSTNVLTPISDVDFPANVVTAVFMDGYFLVLPYGGRVVYYSALEDGTSWDSNDKFEKSQTSDSIRQMIVVGKELWLLGSKTTEVYQDTGDALNPFAPIPGVLIEHGVGAAWSVVKAGGQLCWISQDEDGRGQAWMTRGYVPVRFSTHGVEQQWQQYGGLQSGIAWSYSDGGHTFYVVSFIDENATWVYDLQEGMWHERGYAKNGEFQSHLGINHVFAFDKHLVGSRRDTTLYELSKNYYMDGSEEIVRIRRAPHLAPTRQTTVTIDKLTLDLDVGEGLLTGQGSNPLMSMKYSVDGGNNWSSELFRSMGLRGDHQAQLDWNCLGQGDDWVIEFKSSEPIPQAWTSANVNPEVEAR